MSAAEDAMPPPGLSPRERRHSRPTDSVPSSSRLWPAANRLVMMSSRSKKLPDRPAGSKTSEATASSYVSPVTFSTIRPARLNPAWL